MGREHYYMLSTTLNWGFNTEAYNTKHKLNNVA